MKIIILEGIATSGKTTIKNILTKKLGSKKLSFEVIDEEQTLMPIIENKDIAVSIDLLSKVIKKAVSKNNDFIIFDRLYFTHIFRTNAHIEDFKIIEDIISQHETLLVLLTINEETIPKRIFGAIKHREKNWKNYVKRKGNNNKIMEYYKNQQKLLLDLIEKINYNHIIEDTTDLDFKKITDSIYNKICLNN